MTTQLYFIAANLSDGENADWFVEATSAEEAKRLYRAHLDEIEFRAPDGVVRVFQVPDRTGTPQVCSWYGSVPQVDEYVEPEAADVTL